MSFGRITAILCSTVGGGVVAGAASAALNAASGAAGAAILSASGYADYSPLEGAQMGAIGGAILGGAGGALAGCLAGTAAMFGRSSNDSAKTSAKSSGIASGYVGGAVLAGLTGYGVLNAVSSETVMSLAKTAAAFAVGGAVTMIPATCALICIFVPCVAGALIIADHIQETNYESSKPTLGQGMV
jgi:hypothetical protein